MKILINYATVSGNSAMLTQQMTERLQANHPDIEFVNKDADDCKGEDYTQYDLVIFSSSTWDDGDMNLVAEEYVNQLQNVQGRKFALIGLGDSSYEHFCTGVDKVQAKLQELGAQVVGESHKIDGFIEDATVDSATQWADGIIGSIGQESQQPAQPQASQQVAPAQQPVQPTQPVQPQQQTQAQPQAGFQEDQQV